MLKFHFYAPLNSHLLCDYKLWIILLHFHFSFFYVLIVPFRWGKIMSFVSGWGRKQQWRHFSGNFWEVFCVQLWWEMMRSLGWKLWLAYRIILWISWNFNIFKQNLEFFWIFNIFLDILNLKPVWNGMKSETYKDIVSCSILFHFLNIFQTLIYIFKLRNLI